MTSPSLKVANAIQEWKEAIRDQIDNIGAQRRTPYIDRVRWPLRDPPRNFYTMTERLLVWMAQQHPTVDVGPIHRVYQAIQSIRNGAGVDDLPPQGALEATADSAAMILNVALESILAQQRSAGRPVKKKRASRPRNPRPKYQPPRCPKCAGKVRVASTQGKLRYLKCSECGHNWQSSK